MERRSLRRRGLFPGCLVWGLMAGLYAISAQAAPDERARLKMERETEEEKNFMDGFITTDRPDVSEGSATVPLNRLQWEVGGARLRGDARRLSVDNLLRMGVRQNWELRLGGVAPVRERANSDRRTGLSDFVLGLKRHVADERGARPAMGWLLNLKLPTASAGLGNDHMEGNLLWVANKGFSERWELEVNVGPGFAYDDATFGQAVYAATLSHFIPAGERRIRIFGEAFGAIPAARDKRSATFVGAGVQWWINHNVALDVGFQVGLSRLAKENARSSFYVGVGILR